MKYKIYLNYIADVKQVSRAILYEKKIATKCFNRNMYFQSTKVLYSDNFLTIIPIKIIIFIHFVRSLKIIQIISRLLFF